jgi:hypothetical protein
LYEIKRFLEQYAKETNAPDVERTKALIQLAIEKAGEFRN